MFAANFWLTYVVTYSVWTQRDQPAKYHTETLASLEAPWTSQDLPSVELSSLQSSRRLIDLLGSHFEIVLPHGSRRYISVIFRLIMAPLPHAWLCSESEEERCALAVSRHGNTAPYHRVRDSGYNAVFRRLVHLSNVLTHNPSLAISYCIIYEQFM